MDDFDGRAGRRARVRRGRSTPMRRAVTRGVLAGLVSGSLFWLAGLPSPSLFAGLIAGAVVARASDAKLALPDSVRALGLGVVGVAAGARIDSAVVREISDHPLQVFGGVVGTLAISMLVGQILRLDSDVTGPTALFASIAGGTSGVSVIADEFGADVATVMAIQYLRVVVVLSSIPLVVGILGRGDGPGPVDDVGGNLVSGTAFTVLALALGLVGGRLVKFSASLILMPLLVSGLMAVSGVFPSTEVPSVVVTTGYAIVGLGVGLGFTRGQMRVVLRLLPLGLIQTGLVVVLCAISGMVFAAATGVSRLDGYLATSPGGLPAVVAVALDSGGAVGLVLTVQVVRVFMSLLCAPAVGWWLGRQAARA